jgi:hypothetical protein
VIASSDPPPWVADPVRLCDTCGHSEDDHSTDTIRMFAPPLNRVVTIDHFGCVGNAPDPCPCNEFEPYDPASDWIDDRPDND